MFLGEKKKNKNREIIQEFTLYFTVQGGKSLAV